jgi:hypothetical protein
MREDDTQYDEELTDIIEEAQSVVDQILSEFTTTPLTPVPKIIKFATADLGAAIYHKRHNATGEISPYEDLSKDKINTYINTTFKKGAVQSE